MRVPRLPVRWAADRRRGIAAVLFGILLPVILGLVTLAVDTSVLALARCQLGCEADASALAGAMQLADEYRVRGATDLTSEIKSANAQAQAIGQANLVLGQAPVLNQNTSNAAGGDV